MEQRPQVITSRQNLIIKQARSLHQKKFRERHRAFLVEGPRLIGELLDSSWPILRVLFDPATPGGQALAGGWTDSRSSLLQAVSAEVLQSISDTEQHQGSIAIVQAPDTDIDRWQPSLESLIVVLDGVSDPGNVGTVIRTADAFGAEAVLLTDDCADYLCPKTVRATAGSVFHVPTFQVSRQTLALKLREEGYQMIGASLRGGVGLTAVEFGDRVALILGHETRGIGNELHIHLDQSVTIPMSDRVESLNVGAAATVLCWEVFRRKSLRDG